MQMSTHVEQVNQPHNLKELWNIPQRGGIGASPEDWVKLHLT